MLFTYSDIAKRLLKGETCSTCEWSHWHADENSGERIYSGCQVEKKRDHSGTIHLDKTPPEQTCEKWSPGPVST